MELPKTHVKDIAAHIMRDVEYKSLIDSYALYGYPYLQRIKLYLEETELEAPEKRIPNLKNDIMKYLDDTIQKHINKEKLELTILTLTKENLEDNSKIFNKNTKGALITGIIGIILGAMLSNLKSCKEEDSQQSSQHMQHHPCSNYSR